MRWLTTTRGGLACGVAAAVLLAALCNWLIVLAGWVGSAGSEVVPAGWEWVDPIVGYVWLGLFAGMGTAAWLAYSSGRPTAVRDGRVVVGLMAVCFLYPVYTLGMQAVPGLVANVAVVGLTVAAAAVIRRSSAVAAGMLVPVAVWVSVATVYLAKLVAANA
jgi:tryptophan-rich sensory protein